MCAQALGDAAARDSAAANTRELLKGITERGETFEIEIALAKLDGLIGKREQALASLRALSVDALKRQWLGPSLEARLATLELLTEEHDPAASAATDELAVDARKYGFGWVLMRLESNATGK